MQSDFIDRLDRDVRRRTDADSKQPVDNKCTFTPGLFLFFSYFLSYTLYKCVYIYVYYTYIYIPFLYIPNSQTFIEYVNLHTFLS